MVVGKDQPSPQSPTQEPMAPGAPTMPIFQVLVLVLILLLWFIACLAYAQTDSNSTGETIFAVICFGILAGAILFLLCLAGTFTHIIGWPTP